MYDNGRINVHNPLSNRRNILCNCCFFIFPSVNNSRQFLRCHFSQVLLIVSLGLLVLTNVSSQLQGRPGCCNPCTGRCISIFHYFFKSLNSRGRKLGLVNLVSLLPDFSNDLWRLCQSKGTLSWGSKACKACCFSPPFALMDEVEDKAALSV